MTDEAPANPAGGAERTTLTVDTAAERLRGMLGSEPATETAEADEGNAPEGAEPEETVEAPAETESTAETEPAADEPDEPEEQPKGRYTVKVDGREIKVTFDELRKGFQLESDYRKKTSEIAEQRRQLDAQAAHYGNQLKEFIPALHAQIQDKFAGVDWLKLSQENPAEYVKLQAEATVANQRLQMAMAEQQRIQSETEAKRKADYSDYLKGEQQKLAEKLPVLADPEKGKAFKADMKSYLRESGYTDAEISSLGDHRAALIAYKAMQFDKAQKAKTVVQAQVVKANVPKVQKPGTATRVDPKAAAVSAATERLRKSGKVDDLAAVLRARNRSNSQR
jgi:hypothetical protein